jgi:hypothetical protein
MNSTFLTRAALIKVVQPLLLSARMRWFWSGMLIGALLALGFFIRQPIERGLSHVEGFYTPNVQYGAWYLANHHTLFATTGQLPVVSNYTSGLNYGAVDYTYTFLTGSALILSGVTDVDQIGQLYLMSPWQGLLLMPLAALALYGQYARLHSRRITPAGVAILYAFAALSSYPMVMWAISGGTLVPLGWALFYGIYIALLSRHLQPKYTWQWATLLIMAIVLIQATYHTVALALTVFLVCVWLIQVKMPRKYVAWGIIRIDIMVFVTFLMYHAITLFNDYGRFFIRFLSDIYRGSDQERLRYSLTGGNLSIWWYIVNYAAILLPVAWVALIVVKQRFRFEKGIVVHIYQLTWLLALLPLVVLLFAWDGLYGVYARILQYGTLLAISSAALLLATRAKALAPLALAALVCTVISAYSMRSLDISTSNYLTNDERAALAWASQSKGCDAVLFTDYRIGSAYGYEGCFGAVGPTAGSLSARHQIDILPALFYDADTRTLSEAIDALGTTDRRRPDLILMSRRLLDPQIGVVLPDTRLKPMTEAQWQAYRNLPGWSVAYANDTTMVLARAGT